MQEEIADNQKNDKNSWTLLFLHVGLASSISEEKSKQEKLNKDLPDNVSVLSPSANENSKESPKGHRKIPLYTWTG